MILRGPRTLVIGAGFGGIAVAASLVRAGQREVVVLDRARRVGGVWRDNHYPGCACDIPAPLYSYSFAQNPAWSSRFPGHEEIQRYLEGCVDRFGLRPRLRLGREVTGARWDDDAAVWRVTARRVDDGAAEEFEADVLVPAVGQLSTPKTPTLPGLEAFRGLAFHSARWPDGLDLCGSRVGIVGTGASAIQIAPAIAGTAARVTVFQRSAPWLLPKPTRQYTRISAAAYRRAPALMRLPRAGFWSLTVATGLAVTGNRVAATALRAVAQGQLRLQVRDPALRARARPDYPMGCKRVLFSSDWYPTLARPDVELVTAPIERLTEDAVITTDGGTHQVDILCYTTGFDATRFLVPIEVIGRGGADLQAVWADGARAHLGVTVPQFPNLFLIYGPNTNTGNTSVVYFLEAQARYVVQAVAMLARRRALDPRATLEVRADVAERFDDEMQRRLARSVWVSCPNWYRTSTTATTVGRVVTNWPGRAQEYRTRTAHPDPDHFLAQT